MSTEGVDYGFGRPGGAALAAAGKAFAVRYVPYPGDGGKGLTAAERDDLQSHGLALALVFESTESRALGGKAAGLVDGASSEAALTRLGFPDAIPVYFAVDWDATVAQQAAIDAYLRGAASVLGASRIGVYGGYRVIERCVASHAATWFWQTLAWSAGKVSPSAHLYQYHNGQTINHAAVDFDRALKASYGQWAAISMSGGSMQETAMVITDRTPCNVALAVGVQLYDLAGAPLVTVSVAQSQVSQYGSGVFRAIPILTGGKTQLVLVKTASVKTAPIVVPPDPAAIKAAVDAAIAADRAKARITWGV